MYHRLFVALLFVTVAAFGCDGCGETECDPECTQGFQCDEGVCVSNGECPVECGPDEVCAGTVCIPTDGQCTQVGELCQLGLDVAEGFYCLDQDNLGPAPATCVERCDANGQCSSGGLCFFINSSADPVCASDDQCGELEICQGGACRDTVCLPSECEGFYEGAQTCNDIYLGNDAFPNGGNCFDSGNDAYFCLPAGTRGVGDACEDSASAAQRNDFSLTCESGLACVDSTCRVACRTNDDCSGDSQCLLADENFVDDGTGFCGITCTPFELGSCADGQTCFPVSPTAGTCIAAGTKAAFESCTPGEGECRDGNLCVTYEAGGGALGAAPLARCQPWCNVSVAPAGDDGIVGDFEQAQRDATCPQPDTPSAAFAIANLSGVASIDVYLGDEMTPAVAELATGASSAGTGGFTSLPAANYSVAVLPAGAPRTDPPLFEGTLNLQSEIAKNLIVRSVPGASDEVSAYDFTEERTDVDAANEKVRVLHASPDVGPADVVVVPTGDPLTDPANQTVLGLGLDTADVGAFVAVSPGSYDLLVFPAGDPRTDRATAVVQGLGLTFEAGSVRSIAVSGTVDENDSADLVYAILPYVAPPELGSAGPRFTCVSSGDDVLGYCQQECGDDPAVFGLDLCEGEGMGCRPLLLGDSSRWRNLCGPIGGASEGERCDPFRTWGQCAEGFTCLEYGNAQEGFSTSQRGLCRSLCDTAASTCSDGQSCKPISYDSDYAVGECGYACEPDSNYSGPSCPAGLSSCTPLASLQDPVTGMIPFPRDEQPFCSASGLLAVGETCSGADCVAGSECMFPRSAQTGFVSTLVSQYFGAAGLTPTCTPQCDPFDGDNGPVTCGEGETCLFNFPWSAEVGHCAPIVENVAPEGTCSRPGESCGESSICVVNGAANLCLRFCDYVGDAGDGTISGSNCPNGFQCTPFVADIGVCLSP